MDWQLRSGARSYSARLTVPWQGRRVALVSDHPVAAIGDTDVLVKVVSVAQNPTDWKRTYRDLTTPLPSIQGPAGCSSESTYLLSTLIL